MRLFHSPNDMHKPKRIFKRDRHGCVVWFSVGDDRRTYCYGNGRDFPDDAEAWPEDADSS